MIGNHSECLGNSNRVNGSSCSVRGNENKVKGKKAKVRGDRNRVKGSESNVKGDDNVVMGRNASVIGSHNTLATVQSQTRVAGIATQMILRNEETRRSQRRLQILPNSHHYSFNHLMHAQAIGHYYSAAPIGRVPVVVQMVQPVAPTMPPDVPHPAVPLRSCLRRRTADQIKLTLRGEDTEWNGDADTAKCLCCWSNQANVAGTCCGKLMACMACTKKLYQGKLKAANIKCLSCQAPVEHCIRILS